MRLNHQLWIVVSTHAATGAGLVDVEDDGAVPRARAGFRKDMSLGVNGHVEIAGKNTRGNLASAASLMMKSERSIVFVVSTLFLPPSFLEMGLRATFAHS